MARYFHASKHAITAWRKKLSHGPSDGSMMPADAREMTRIGKILSRATCPGWQLCTQTSLSFVAFRSDPEQPRTLQRLGPWPVPEDAGEEEVLAAVRLAVASVAGEEAAAAITLRPAKQPGP